MKKCLIILALVCCSGAQAQTAAAASPNASALQVVSSSFSTNDGMVTVLAEVKNTADIKASEVVLEARLKDADGKLIDVISEQSYGFVVPAGQQLAVRLFERAGAPVAKYATAEVKVVDAEFRRPAPPRNANANRSPWWIELLVSWGPMLLLIGVWLLFMRKYNGKDSYQSKLLDSMTEQNALLTRQVAALESVAASRSQPGTNG